MFYGEKMGKALLITIILLLLFSFTFIFYISLVPPDGMLKKELEKHLKWHNFLFINISSLEERIAKDYNVIIDRVSFLPLGIKIKWEEEKTFVVIKKGDKKYYYNQKFYPMDRFIGNTDIIEVEGTSDINMIKDIINVFSDKIEIKRIKFLGKYFEIYSNNIILRLNIDDYNEKIQLINEILGEVANKSKKILDFRFHIPSIGG